MNLFSSSSFDFRRVPVDTCIQGLKPGRMPCRRAALEAISHRSQVTKSVIPRFYFFKRRKEMTTGLYLWLLYILSEKNKKEINILSFKLHKNPFI